MKSGNLNFLERSGPHQACNGTALFIQHNNAKQSLWSGLEQYCFNGLVRKLNLYLSNIIKVKINQVKMKFEIDGSLYNFKLQMANLMNYSTYLLMSMEQCPSWVANQSSASQEIPAFYGTWRFSTMFTSSHHLSLSWARSIHSMTPPFHFPDLPS